MDKRVVVIGGGTGQGNLLQGLKKYTTSITAIVTVADDGGGSGLIRSENRMLPPGDIRNCLLALSSLDPLMEQLIRHRYESGSIKNQNFGNLLILAFYEIFGDFEKSIDYVGKMINAKGKVIPSTMEQVRLVGKLENDNVAIGESNIASMAISQMTEIRSLELLPSSPKATDSAIKAIENAQMIIIGPGSLYTSIIANLLIPEISQAIIKSPAKKIFVCNIMTEQGETDNFTPMDHINRIKKHVPDLKFDYIMVNSKRIEENVKRQYEADHKHEVVYNDEQKEKIKALGLEVISGDFAKVTDFGHIIHDADKVFQVMFEIL